jgi:hypothetical protein
MTRELHPFLKELQELGSWSPPEQPANGRRPSSSQPVPAAGDPQAQRYAAQALTDEASHVAGTQPGGRNHALNTAAFRMGQLAAHGWLAQHEIEDALLDAATRAGLPLAETEATIRSGLDAGLAAPRAGVELTAGQPVGPAYTLDPESATSTVDSLDVDNEEAADEHGWPRQVVEGDTYIYDTPPAVPAIWGDGDDVLWAEGEPLLLTGPTGTGKTTLGGMVIAARMGLLGDVLGYPVQPGRRILLLAMDRPRQIQRALARLLRNYPRDVLNERLVVWQGPPPADLAKHPTVLLAMAQRFDCDTVVIDSLKDAAIGLSTEETGQGISRAFNHCVTNGVQVLVYHHQTKRTGNAQGKPNTIADVYGSSWITAGVGSVILLWGNPGDPIVELKHLKQPAGDVGPLVVEFDHLKGWASLYEAGHGDQILELLSSGPSSAPAIASWLHGGEADHAAVVKIRRRLDKFVAQGVLVRLEQPATPPRAGGGRFIGKPTAHRYALADGRRPLRSAFTVVTDSDERADERNLGSGTLNFDESPGRAEKHGLERPKNEKFERRGTQNRVSPGRSEERAFEPKNAPPKNAPPPPIRGEGRVDRAGGEVSDPSNPMTFKDSSDEHVCDRCYQPATHLIPAPVAGKYWCRVCAYPTERHEEDDE